MSDARGIALLDPRAARRALQNARGKQKLDLILSAPDPQQLVSWLPPEELYFALLDIGPDDAAELVAMASPEQFRHFVDMSAWRGADEGPRTSEVIHWLRLAREKHAPFQPLFLSSSPNFWPCKSLKIGAAIPRAPTVPRVGESLSAH